MGQEKKWEKVGPFSGAVFAESFAEILRQKNIPYIVHQDGVSTALGVHGNSLVGNVVYVLVPAEFYTTVQELFESFTESTEEE